MTKTATLLKKSENGRKAIYIDDENAEAILKFLKETKGTTQKFWMVVNLILEGRPPRDLYDKEDIEKGCENVTAIKLFKGKRNPRIYCQQYAHGELKIYVIVLSEILPKKTSQGISKKEKSLIRKVAKKQYTLHD